MKAKERNYPQIKMKFFFSRCRVPEYRFKFFSDPKLSLWCTMLKFRAYISFSDYKINACSLHKIWKMDKISGWKEKLMVIQVCRDNPQLAFFLTTRICMHIEKYVFYNFSKIWIVLYMQSKVVLNTTYIINIFHLVRYSLKAPHLMCRLWFIFDVFIFIL